MRRGHHRLRLLPYFLVLALPLVLGVWAFANSEASHARDRTDDRLRMGLALARNAYGDTLDAAAQDARAIARSRTVQRALAHRSRGPLTRIAERRPHVAFYSHGKLLAGRREPMAPRRSVKIMVGRNWAGRVEVAVPVDKPLLRHLKASSELPRGENLVARIGRRTIPAGLSFESAKEASIRGAAFRAASGRVIRTDPQVRLAVLVPRATVAADERHAQHGVLLAGLAILGGVALVAYGLAPAIARGRFAREQRAQATQVLAHIGDGVFLLGSDGRIALWNPGAEDITGIRAGNALGRRPEEVIGGWANGSPPPAPHLGDGSAGRPAAQTARYDVDGRELWLSVAGVQFPEGTVYTFRDISEEHRLEEARADFVATVSHELRTPLASIHGAAATLQRRQDELHEPTRHRLLEIIYDQTNRLAHLVDQILLANQLTSGSVHIETRPFDPVELAEHVVDGLRPAAPASITLEVESPAAVPPVAADPDRTRQVLQNLVENAIKYSPRGGRIHVQLAQTNGHVCFSVSDEGLGIPINEQKRIFEKFFRLDPSMTRGIGGSGLGLYICRELVELMDGRLRVRSEPGVGSTFAFDLPVAEAA